MNQQLAERLPGSVQIFVEALQKLRKNTKLTETDLYDEMKAGKLLAKDILPLVGEAMSDAARRGGALDMMLKGNGVAMRRLATTWQNAQNIIFQSGFGDALTDLFNNLAENINNNSPVFRGIGEFFTGVVNFAKDMANGINDFFILSDAIITHFATKWGVDLKGVLEWAGYIGGIVAVSGALLTTFRILSWITGLKGSLEAIAGAMRIISGGAPVAATTAAGAAGVATKGSGLLGRVLGILGLGGMAVDAAGNWYDSTNAAIDATSSVDKYNKIFRNYSWQDMFTPPTQATLPGTASPIPFNNINPMANNPSEIPVKVDPITVILQLKADELRGLIDASVEDNNLKQINLLMQDGE